MLEWRKVPTSVGSDTLSRRSEARPREVTVETTRSGGSGVKYVAAVEVEYVAPMAVVDVSAEVGNEAVEEVENKYITAMRRRATTQNKMAMAERFETTAMVRGSFRFLEGFRIWGLKCGDGSCGYSFNLYVIRRYREGACCACVRLLTKFCCQNRSAFQPKHSSKGGKRAGPVHLIGLWAVLGRARIRAGSYTKILNPAEVHSVLSRARAGSITGSGQTRPGP